MSTSENIYSASATVFDGECGACDAAPALGMHSHKLGPEIGRRLSRLMKERGLVDRCRNDLEHRESVGRFARLAGVVLLTRRFIGGNIPGAALAIWEAPV